ncbi:MAG: PorP/SprF family type IX secretion system membrane protein [Bacteroidales bacterium]|nr:PorP/SprF family type IX secretion system membrane protein [Bacteroidales bacterium]
MKNIKFILGTIFVLLVNITNAQQIKNNNLYTQNPVLYNPSTVLNEDLFRVYVNSHLQWIGYNGSPKNNEFGVGMSFAPNMGAGLSVISNRIGLYNNMQASLKYAYRLNFEDQHSLNMGLSLGVSNSRLMAENAENVDVNDVTLLGDYSKITSVVSGFGLDYRLHNFEAQFMMPQLFEQKVLNLYSIGIVAYNFEISPLFDFKPSVLLRSSKASSVQFDVNAMAIWKEMIWAQASYRSKNSYIFSVGMNISNYSVGYVYQAETQPLSVSNSGTHEIQLIYRLGNGVTELKVNKTNVYGKILNEYDNSPVSAKIIVYENDVKIAEIQSDSERGFYNLELNPEKSYRFEIQSEDYNVKNELVNVEKDETEKEQIFTLKPQKTYVTGKILDKNSEHGVEADIYVMEGNKIVSQTKSNNLGEYAVYLDPQKEYNFRITSENHDKKEQSLVIGDEGKMTENFEVNPFVSLSGIVVDKETGKPISVKVEIYDNDNDKTLGIITTDSETGEYSIDLKDASNISITALSPDYALFSENLSVDFTSYTVVKNLTLEPLTIEGKVVLTNVFFDINSDELKPEAVADIDRLISVLEQNPEVKVEISGYTDNTGTEQYNKNLSKRRAKSVVNYMIENGIAANRLKVVGYGISNPKAPNDTEENRQLNRRVEAKIIYK